MPSQYNGIPGNITYPSSLTVSGASNATPIEITTTAPHLLTNGDVVDVTGVGGNTAANGQWAISVVDGTHFLLVGSAGNGAYTSGGHVQSLSMGPTFQIPSDGDTLDAASVNTALEALGDRTAALGEDIGAIRWMTTSTTGADDGSSQATVQFTHSFANVDTWEDLTSGGFVTVSNLQANDVVDIEVTGSATWNSNVATFVTALALYMASSPQGGSLSSYAKVPNTTAGSAVRLPTAPSGGGWAGFSLRARATVPAAANELFFHVFGFCGNATSATINIVGDLDIIITVRRPTGKPQ